jgi:hypothetical protein
MAQPVIGVLQASETALAEAQDGEFFFDRNGKNASRGEDCGSKIDVARRISAAVKLGAVEGDIEGPEDRTRGQVVLGQVAGHFATGKIKISQSLLH